MSSDQNKEVEIKARVTPSIKAAVHAIAVRRGEADSVIVREAVTEYLRDHKALAQHDGRPEGPRPSRKQQQSATASDSDEVLLPVFATIPAGLADDRPASAPERLVPVRGRRFPRGAFGLVVTGNSMNVATGRPGPIHHGDTVILAPFTRLEDVLGRVVAALVDGQTTLKRLVFARSGDYHLRPESDDPDCTVTIVPRRDLLVQGVVVDKL